MKKRLSLVFQNHQTSITDSILTVKPLVLNWLNSLKLEKLVQNLKLKLEPESSLRISDGTRMMLKRFGPSDLTQLDPTSLLIQLNKLNSWMKFKTQLNLLSSGSLEKDHSLKITLEESDGTLMMLFSMLMPFTEVLVKLCLLPERLCLLLIFQEKLDSGSLFSLLKSSAQMRLLVESTTFSTREEENTSERNKFPEPHSRTSKLISQSPNHSVSLPIWELKPQEEPSLNASLTIGTS